jgi:hypothetical protein
MRAKFIYEKFIEETDPIHDLGIGYIKEVKKFIEECIKSNLFREYDFAEERCTCDTINRKNIIINDDLTIDIKGWVDFSDNYAILPDYIRFNHIYGDFACEFNRNVYKKCMPKQVDGEIRYYTQRLSENKKIIIKNIKKVCKVGKNVKIERFY